MNKWRAFAIAMLVVGVIVGVALYEGELSIKTNVCFAEVSGDFDSIQITSVSLTDGFDKEDSAVGLVSFESGELNKSFKDPVYTRYAWQVNVFCTVNGSLEATYFEMITNSTMFVGIHSSGANLTLVRNIRVTTVFDATERAMYGGLVLFVCTIPALAVLFGWGVERSGIDE